MSLGFMVAAASRKRDDRGRYMEGPEMRRQRDSRGRYMEGDEDHRMAYEDGHSAWQPWPEPHIPPYLEKPRSNYDRRMDHPDGQNPYGEQPEVYRRQEEHRMKGKTSGGEINYNRPDGGYGNVRYFMHKTDPMQHHDGEEHFEQPRQIGFHANENALNKESVMGWVEEMVDDDGVHGGKYSWHQAQQYALNVGVSGEQRVLEFYWAMNAMYADYHKVAKKFGVDKPDFYACLAKAFIEDPDAVKDKVEKYVKHITRHGER